MKKTLLLFFVAIFSLSIVNAQINNLNSGCISQINRESLDSLISNEKMLAIQQMNYHTISMSRIIHNQSLETLDYELSQLLNNLTIEHIIDLPEIKLFREKLMISVQELQVTAEERMVLRRLQDLRRSNFIWESMSKALNPTMIMTSASNHYQMAFYALLTAARGGVSYQSLSEPLVLEEVQSLWELRKTDLGTIKELRTDAFTSIYDLYRRFKFNENIRLVEQDAELYANILNEKNADKRLRRLLDNYYKFSHLLDYEYYLGMAYLDVDGYEAAKPHLNKYIVNYAKTPIFRKDEKSAFVYLAQLTYEHLSHIQIDDIINKIVHIIPNNGPALIQCALKYYEIGMYEKAFTLIRKGLDNPYISNKSSIVMLSASLSTQIKCYPKLWKDIQTSILQSDDLSLDSFVAFISCCSESVMSKELNNIFKIKDATQKRWRLFGKSQLRDKYALDINRKYSVDLNTISAYYEKSDGAKTSITQAEVLYGDGVYTKKRLFEKVSAFKSSPMLIYNFFSPMGQSEFYRVKSGLDLKKDINHYNGTESMDSKSVKRLLKILKQDLKSEYYSAKCKPINLAIEAFNIDSVFTVDFYKQWNYFSLIPATATYGHYKNISTVVKRYNRAKGERKLINVNFENRNISFKGDTLMYMPIPEYKIEESCIRIVLNDKLKSIVTFVLDDKSGNVVPFSLMANGIIYYLMDTSNLEEIKTTDIDKQNNIKKPDVSEPKKDNWFKRIWNKIFG